MAEKKKKPAAKAKPAVKKPAVKKAVATKPQKKAVSTAKKPAAAVKKTATTKDRPVVKKTAAPKAIKTAESKPAEKPGVAPVKPVKSSVQFDFKILLKNKLALIAGAGFLAIIIIGGIFNKFSGMRGFSGEYKCEGGIYDSLEFTPGNRVYLTALGIRSDATYEVEGNKVFIVDTDGKSIVFTKEDEALVTSVPLLGEVVCKK
jgi:hypothetical protein